MAAETIRDTGSVVAIGSFNPMAVQPWWLFRVGLVSEKDAEQAKVEGITSEFSVLELSWVRIEVLRNRFAATSTSIGANGQRLLDLVSGLFSTLPHTPINQLGLNRDTQYQLLSVDEWHAVGHALAPKGFWNDHLKRPGLKSLAIQSDRMDNEKGQINVTVRPVLDPAVPNTIECAYNSHFVLPEQSTGSDVPAYLAKYWFPTLQAAEELSKLIVMLGKANDGYVN